MKRISVITLLAAATVFMPPRANADDEGRALVGGILGGIIIGAVLADSDVDTHISVGYRDHGYWDWVSVKTWVPGYFERRHDRFGRHVKIWIDGHYTFVKQKVWVEAHRGHRRHFERRHDGHHRRHHARRHGDHWTRRGGYRH